MPRPIPVPDELSKPFWDACNEGRLTVQNCSACNRKQYPPEPTCRDCGKSDTLGWVDVTGRGKIHGYTVMHDSRIVAWQPEQPYNTAAVQLEDYPEIKFFSNVPGVPADQVPVGAAVQVEFIEVSPTQKIPEWRLALTGRVSHHQTAPGRHVARTNQASAPRPGR